MKGIWTEQQQINRLTRDVETIVYHEIHREEERKKNLDYYHRNQKKRNEQIKGYALKLKILILQHYSSELKCQNPKCLVVGGCKDLRALSIDHINGGGTQHRKIAPHTYRWIKKNNFPSGFQVLCMNCQWIKRVECEELSKA